MPVERSSHHRLDIHIGVGCALFGGIFAGIWWRDLWFALGGAIVTPALIGSLWGLGVLWARGLGHWSRKEEASAQPQEE